jgi:hypothetical protein
VTPPATPPEAPFDVQAHQWADAMLPRADAHRLDGPLWARWALVEAFAAGKVAGAAEEREACAKLAGAAAARYFDPQSEDYHGPAGDAAMALAAEIRERA